MKDQTPPLSNVDILIVPCDPTHSCPSPPRGDMVKLVQKTHLEATASFPLDKSRVLQYLSSPTLNSRKSVSGVLCSPSHQNQGCSLALPLLMVQKNEGRAQQSGLPGEEPGNKNVDRHHDNGEEANDRHDNREVEDDDHHGNGDEEEEERTYPTLRSKSLNAGPKKTRTSMRDEKKSSSVKDLVSVFHQKPKPETLNTYGSEPGPETVTRQNQNLIGPELCPEQSMVSNVITELFN